ncbi:GNAT superfamily N-acetyltransferase [Streptomyces sp. V4I2]|nr:GNAT superfamily N-acetyltransferase [Streptomyces sp. V4I2]
MTRKYWASTWAAPANRFAAGLVAQANGHVLGVVAGAGIGLTLPGVRVSEEEITRRIALIAVQPDHRRKGLGTRPAGPLPLGGTQTRDGEVGGRPPRTRPALLRMGLERRPPQRRRGRRARPRPGSTRRGVGHTSGVDRTRSPSAPRTLHRARHAGRDRCIRLTRVQVASPSLRAPTRGVRRRRCSSPGLPPLRRWRPSLAAPPGHLPSRRSQGISSCRRVTGPGRQDHGRPLGGLPLRRVSGVGIVEM